MNVQYFFIILLFAIMYLNISERREECHVGLTSIMEAYIFSLETIVSEPVCSLARLARVRY